MIKHKRLTSKSGLTVPKDLRAEAGFFPGMAVDMSSTAEGIVIKPHVPLCRFCGAAQDVIKVEGITFCRSCAEKIQKAVNNHAVSE